MSGRVFVVDDDPIIREMIDEALSAEGYAVEAVGDGVAAIAKLRTDQRFDAILLDLVMPAADGYKVINFLLDFSPATLRRVVIISSKPDTIFRSVWGVFKKPFTRSQIVRIVRECMKDNGPIED